MLFTASAKEELDHFIYQQQDKCKAKAKEHLIRVQIG
jgi:hypothetical protein